MFGSPLIEHESSPGAHRRIVEWAPGKICPDVCPGAKAETKSSKATRVPRLWVAGKTSRWIRWPETRPRRLDLLVRLKIPTRLFGASELSFRVLRIVLKRDLGEVKRKLVGWNQFASTVPSRLIAGNQDVTQLHLVVLLLLFPGFAYR